MNKLLPSAIRPLLACNRLSAPYGLALSAAEAEMLALRREVALKDNGRIAFGDGIWRQLVYHFCDSPFLAPESYTDTLAELLACFYHAKSEGLGDWPDEELLAYMRRQFDGVCQGSADYLAGTVLEAACRAARFGQAPPAGGGPANEDDCDVETEY